MTSKTYVDGESSLVIIPFDDNGVYLVEFVSGNDYGVVGVYKEIDRVAGTGVNSVKALVMRPGCSAQSLRRTDSTTSIRPHSPIAMSANTASVG